jgi:isopentenyldiphosphate isomerase
MTELWQLYDDQGNPIAGKGASKEDVYGKALLHAAAHVWIWRKTDRGIEVLLQKRARNKRTWGGRYDISAAGPIDLGEEPITAAIRETQEEIGFNVNVSDLHFIGVDRRYLVAPDKSWTENELNWLYSLKLDASASFRLEDGEVDSLGWKTLTNIQTELSEDSTVALYVPHGKTYYALVFAAIKQQESGL